MKRESSCKSCFTVCGFIIHGIKELDSIDLGSMGSSNWPGSGKEVCRIGVGEIIKVFLGVDDLVSGAV